MGQVFVKLSHPHGCVSWNLLHDINYPLPYVTPSRVCELKLIMLDSPGNVLEVTPSRVCELKFDELFKKAIVCIVTPSRVCELKSIIFIVKYNVNGHTLTGVWVEIL